MQTWALSLLLLISADGTVHGVPVVRDHTLAPESSLLQLSRSQERTTCESDCRYDGEVLSCMERVQQWTTGGGHSEFSVPVATAVELVRRECDGQCACSVADVLLESSSSLPSTTPQQSTQTSAAAETTTVEPTTSISSIVIGTKTFPDQEVTLELELDDTAGDVIFRLAGPRDVWFGIGFNALTMADRPYAVIVDGSDGSVTERKLGWHSGGYSLDDSLEELSPPSYINGKCHVEFKRPLAGRSPDHFSFSPAAPSLNLIAAVGGSTSFIFHTARADGVMSLARR